MSMEVFNIFYSNSYLIDFELTGKYSISANPFQTGSPSKRPLKKKEVRRVCYHRPANMDSSSFWEKWGSVGCAS